MKHDKQIMQVPDGNLPDWYWCLGLHDAVILSAEQLEFPYDYRQKDPIRNCFVIRLDPRQAMFDRVKEIRLYNYKILTPEIDLAQIDKPWWIKDALTQTDGGYHLAITVESANGDRVDFKIRFRQAEVEK